MSVSRICELFGMSRKTYYKWRKRYEDEGVEGLSERSRRPKRLARLRPEPVAARVIRARRRKGYGPVLLAWYLRRHGGVASESSGKNRIALHACTDALRAWMPTAQEKMLHKMSYHERLIYDLAVKNQLLLSTDLWAVYADDCQKTGITPVARRTFSKYVKLMVDRGLLSVDPRTVAGKGRLLRAREN